MFYAPGFFFPTLSFINKNIILLLHIVALDPLLEPLDAIRRLLYQLLTQINFQTLQTIVSLSWGFGVLGFWGFYMKKNVAFTLISFAVLK